MKVSEIIEQLSPEAKRMLSSMSDRIGAHVPASTGDRVWFELRDLGVIGAHTGLTIKGSAVVCMLRLEDPFA